MKMQIRQGVFETNSSSTHSMTFANSVVEARDIVDKMIYEAYKEDVSIYSNYEENFFRDNNHTLVLEGFDIESGEENKNVYYILNNWMAKLQYIHMIFATWYDNFASYKNPEDRYYYRNVDLEQYEEYRYFIDLCKEYVKNKGYEINNVIVDYSYTIYFDNDNINELKKPITKEKVKSLFDKIMDDSYNAIYCDEAYRPYYKPEITII